MHCGSRAFTLAATDGGAGRLYNLAADVAIQVANDMARGPQPDRAFQCGAGRVGGVRHIHRRKKWPAPGRLHVYAMLCVANGCIPVHPNLASERRSYTPTAPRYHPTSLPMARATERNQEDPAMLITFDFPLPCACRHQDQHAPCGQAAFQGVVLPQDDEGRWGLQPVCSLHLPAAAELLPERATA